MKITMKLLPFLLVSQLVLSASFARAAESVPSVERVVEKFDRAMVERNGWFGYEPEYVLKHFSEPHVLEYDFSGIAADRIKQPPAPGVHPRVLFNAEELPEIRRRLANTKAGKKIHAAIRKHSADQLTGPNAKYAAPYVALIDGDESVPIHQEASIAYGVLYEAFRCLIDEDQDGMFKAAAAITTIARIDRRVLEESRAKMQAKGEREARDFEFVGQAATQEGTLGLMYDFAFNAMTPAQRDTVRETIAAASGGMTIIGAESLRTFNTAASNHIPWLARLIYLTASIEGEQGFDAASHRRALDAMKWFYGLGIFRSGDAYEGWGKNFLFAEHAWIAARHGEPIHASLGVRNAFRNYYIHALNPWGGNFTFYDSSGGTGNKLYRQADVLVYKRMFPGDRAIDFIYRNQISPDYREFGGPINTRHPFMVTEALCLAIFADDFDETKSWDEAHAAATANLPTTYWCEDTGNMIARSSWDKDALYLHYLNRSVGGGHVYCDRGHFNLYALGRYWGIYKPLRQVREAYMPKNRSGVMVDGDGVSVMPGKCVAHRANPLAAMTATDLKPSYDYIYNYIFHNETRTGNVRPPFGLNFFRLKPTSHQWMDIPIDELPNWHTSRIPDPPPGQPVTGRPPPFHGWRQRPVLYQKAFRSACLVRGEKPYALIIDDIDRDGSEHEYTWGMTLADDLVLEKSELVTDPVRFRADAFLAEKDRPAESSRRLLVRMVEGRNLVGETPAAITPVVSANPPQKDTVIPKLTFTSRAVQPSFKALLVPLKPGEEAPETAWSNERRTLTITWRDQSDRIDFSEGDDGRTRFRITRGNEILIDPN
jgi:hypothetical protein